MNNWALREVEPTAEDVQLLFDSLSKRNHTISHRKMPTFEQHLQFVSNHPYRKWFLVYFQLEFKGHLYVKYDNAVGLHMSPDVTSSQLGELWLALTGQIAPQKVQPSMVPDHFYVNVPTSNLQMQSRLEAANFVETQRSYRFSLDTREHRANRNDK